jgi:TPR repeat protein
MMNRMKSGITAAAFVAAMGLAAPAEAQMHGNDQPYGSGHEMPTPDVPRPVSRDAGSAAEDLRLAGKCDKAIPILRRVVNGGGDTEISQFNLGLCLLDLAQAEHDAAQQAADRKEAADWIVRSANAGFAKAQAEAVVLYLDGTGVAADPVEAKKWALLYHSNPLRFSIVLPDIAADITDRMDAALTDAKRAEARARANAWTKTASATDD